MKVIKPFRLSVVTRSYEVNRVYYLGVSTLAFFDLVTNELLPEVALWQFAAKELGKDVGIDVGVPKLNAEFLVTGSVFTPNGEMLETCPSSARLGSVEKSVYAIGDRFWKGDEQSKPQKFASMPLVWERAYGGPGFPPNTYGKGHAPVQTEHGPVQFLPNLEQPGKLIQRPNDVRDPACYGALDLTRPQRLSKAGTYDLAWLDNLFPGVAADMDWTFWNIAPADQQTREGWRGDETFELKNLHPTKPTVKGRLPNLKARTFLSKRDAAGVEALHELDTRLTTVWFFPHALKGILVFQGAIPTMEDDATDVTLMMLAAEKVGAPREREHYQRVLTERLDRDRGPFLLLRDEDLLPPDLVAAFETEDDIAKMKKLVMPDGVLQERQAERVRRKIDEARAVIASYGLNPDEHGPSQPAPFEKPELSDLPKLMAQLEEQARKAQAEMEAEVEKRIVAAEPMMESHGVDPSFLRAELKETQIGPPTFTAAGELERMKQMDAESRSVGIVLDELQLWITSPEIYERWLKAEEAMRDAYVLSAHMQSPAPRLEGAALQLVRAETLAALAKGEPFAHRDLTGADLSGLDLRGVDFRRGWLESANLANAVLDGANLSDCVLARADLSGASLKGVVARGANFGGAVLDGARSGGQIDLTDAILTKANLTNADLSGALLDNANLSEAIFDRTNLSSVTAQALSFFQTDLRGASFAGAKLKMTTFVDCTIAGVDFTGAELEGVAFMQCRAAGVRLARVRTKKLVVCLAESFEGADFRGAQLEMANLRGTKLQKADFSEALLDGADLSEADLTEAKMYRAVARGARFMKTLLVRADLTSINLMGSDLQKADVSGTNFRGANLHATNFAKVRSRMGQPNMEDALRTKMTIHPLYRPPT